ncbi:hypothetical protein [Scytonema sp. NUACC26]
MINALKKINSLKALLQLWDILLKMPETDDGSRLIFELIADLESRL